MCQTFCITYQINHIIACSRFISPFGIEHWLMRTREGEKENKVKSERDRWQEKEKKQETEITNNFS